MSAVHSSIVAQPEDPELRQHRERVLAAHPWLRGRKRDLVVVSAAGVLVWLLAQWLG
jgi:hypothetical protein